MSYRNFTLEESCFLLTAISQSLALPVRCLLKRKAAPLLFATSLFPLKLLISVDEKKIQKFISKFLLKGD